MVQVLAIIGGAVVLYWVVRKAFQAAIQGAVTEALPRPPAVVAAPPTPPPIPLATKAETHAKCPDCWELFFTHNGELERCDCCRQLRERKAGERPDLDVLPPGYVIDVCERCCGQDSDHVPVTKYSGPPVAGPFFAGWACAVCDKRRAEDV